MHVDRFMKHLAVIAFLLSAIHLNAQPIEVKPLNDNEARQLDLKIIGKDIVKAFEVRDRDGYTDVVISKNNIGKEGAEGFSNALFGIAGLNDHGGLLPSWSFKQYNQNVLEDIDFASMRIEVKDMDKDGYAEYYIAYKMSVDGLDPDTWKILVYSRNKKYIRLYKVLKEENRIVPVPANEDWMKLKKELRVYAERFVHK